VIVAGVRVGAKQVAKPFESIVVLAGSEVLQLALVSVTRLFGLSRPQSLYPQTCSGAYQPIALNSTVAADEPAIAVAF